MSDLPGNWITGRTVLAPWLSLLHRRDQVPVMWRSVVEASFGKDMELAAIDDEDVHALVFPCQPMPATLVNAMTGEILNDHPTRWCAWFVQRAYVADTH
jgi:hypothetical protein